MHDVYVSLYGYKFHMSSLGWGGGVVLHGGLQFGQHTFFVPYSKRGGNHVNIP